MKRKLVTSFGLAVGLLMICAPVFAHHGGSDYDTQNLLTLKGTVTEFLWENPHCQVFLDVKKDDSDKAVNWGIETLAPAVLNSRLHHAEKPADSICLFPVRLAELLKALHQLGLRLTVILVLLFDLVEECVELAVDFEQ